MKKTLLFISAFVFGLALRAQHIDSLSFSMTQISLTTENGYTRVFMQSCDITTDIGYPELPVLPNLQFGSREAGICNAG